jgi:hypothetical protein
MGPLPTISLASGATVTLLGPSRTKLASFASDWALELAEFGRFPAPVLGSRPRPIPRPGGVERIAAQLDTADRGKANGTSIAFVIQYGGRRALFLADAHPDDMAVALRRFAREAGRVRFDLIKVAHHGSARNNTSALIDQVDSELWLISSDGSRHQHPDPEAVARIVLAPQRKKTLIFNYHSRANEVWSQADLQEYYGYSVRFPERIGPISVDLA